MLHYYIFTITFNVIYQCLRHFPALERTIVTLRDKLYPFVCVFASSSDNRLALSLLSPIGGFVFFLTLSGSDRLLA